MFGIKQLSSFEEFEQEVEEIVSGIETAKKNNPLKIYSAPLFRGQTNSSWKLKSTLERTERYLESSEFTYLHYLQILRNVQKDIQRETGKKWNLNQTFGECNLNNYNYQPTPYREEYEFMAYLRHHRFPSPLLDWTSSMKVASFFAFQDPSDEENVSVYVYLEYIGRGDFGWMGKPNIETLGPNIKPDMRHEKQESSYMLSIATIEGRKIICNIEDAIKNKIYIDKKLKKYLIPFREREKVLEELERSGIDAHSLFQDDDEDSLSEDLLMERLKKREFPEK